MFSEIRAIFSRHYLLQNTAMEVFMANRSEWEPQLLHFQLFQQLFVISRRCDTSSLFPSRSVGHVQLSRPGDSQESDLQSSSSGSGHQLRSSTGQVGHTILSAMSIKALCFCDFLAAVVTFCALCVAACLQPLIWSPTEWLSGVWVCADPHWSDLIP